MNFIKLFKNIVPLFIFAFLFYSCSDSSTSPDVEDLEITKVNLENRDSGEEFSHTHGSGSSMHWHGSLPHLHPGEGVEVNVNFVDGNDQPVSLGSEYTVQARLASGSDEGVIEINNHGDHVDIEAIGEGEVEVIFALWHDGHSEFDSPSITIEVESHDDHGSASEISGISLIDRDSGDELAHTHGTGEDMNWHGTLPHLHSGEGIEIDVVFSDSDGEPITLGEDYTVQARLAEGASEGVVEIESHGDHVEIEAIGEGEVEIIFALWHDDQSEFDAPVISVEVDDHHD